jgi:hypothetical protein
VIGSGLGVLAPNRSPGASPASSTGKEVITGACSARLIGSLTRSLVSSLVCFHGGFAIWLPFAILTSNLALQLERLLKVHFFVGVNSAVLDDFVCYDRLTFLFM